MEKVIEHSSNMKKHVLELRAVLDRLETHYEEKEEESTNEIFFEGLCKAKSFCQYLENIYAE